MSYVSKDRETEIIITFQTR